MIKLLIAILVILNLLLVGLGGCKTSEDSGSTVTGRALSFPNEQPMPFVRVLINGDSGLGFKVTDSNGSYLMSKMPVGTYTVTFAGFGVTLTKKKLVVEQPEQTYVVDLPQVEPGDEIFDGICTDIYGNKLTGADIRIIFPGGQVAHTITGNEGEFGINNLPDSNAYIIAEIKGFKRWTSDNLKIGFEGVRNLHIELTPLPTVLGGDVSGTVRDAAENNLADAYIGAFKHDVALILNAHATQEVLSGPTGYLLENLPPDSYTIICIRSGYKTISEKLVVEEGKKYTLDFKLEPE